jgi:hypothetical protein
MLKLRLVFVVFIFIPQYISAETFQSKQDNFVITIPDSWVQIPSDTLEELVKETNEMTGGKGQGLNFNYAYQVDRKGLSVPGRFKNPELDKWMLYPYIVAQVFHQRISEDAIYKYINNKSFKDLVKKAEKMALEGSEIISSLASDKPFYDHQNKIIWIKATIKKNAEGLKKLDKKSSVTDLVGLVLTNTGTIGFHCYYESQQENIYMDACSNIIRSVRSPGNEYKTSLTWEKLFKKVLPKFLFEN